MNTNDITEKLGITPNAMQEASFRAILHTNRDVVVLSPTGTGKTLAYLLPLASRLDATSNEVQAVVIVPGRELARQSLDVLRSLGSGLRGMALHGGRPTMDEHRELRQQQPHIIFATPGRLNDHLDKGNFSTTSVRWLVIDEFDKCLEMGFQDEMARAIEQLPHVERRILLSATEAEAIPQFVSLRRTERIDFRIDDEQTSDRVSLFLVRSPQRDKLDTLGQLLRSLQGESTIVFLNYRDSVERTAAYLHEQGFALTWYHGGLEQQEREQSLYRFQNGSANVLVSTDLASRGLDIPDVQNIVHYHLPETEDNYVHRVGRTARWDKEGRTFFLLNADEQLPDYVSGQPADYAIPTELPLPVPARMRTIYIGKGKRDKISKGDVVGFLCKKGGLSAKDIGRIDVKDRYTYAAIVATQVKQLLNRAQGEKIKGVKTIVELVKD